MKKIILTMLVAGSLLATSCKEAKKGANDLKDATVEAADKTVDATKNAANTAADATKDAANAVAEGAEKAVEEAKELVSGSVLEGVKIPEFSNPEVTKNLTEYAAYAKDYIAANGNLGKISALASKGKELMAKGQELASKLDAPELAKYKSALAAIQSKMAPSK